MDRTIRFDPDEFLNEGSAPLVSVIIPCYNAEKFITSTINSVLHQTYKNIEILAIEDHSKDQTLAVLQDLATKDIRLKVLRTPSNSGGPARPRNIGVEQARGKYLAFLDSDDIWHPQKLWVQVALMEAFDLPFTATKKTEFKQDSEIEHTEAWKKKYVKRELIDVQTVDHDQLLQKNILPNSSVVLLKDLLSSIKFDERAIYSAIEDYHAWLRIHQKISSVLICHDLIFYRIVPTSISRSKVSMFAKINNMLREYRVNGRRLGLKRFVYLGTYIAKSVLDRI